MQTELQHYIQTHIPEDVQNDPRRLKIFNRRELKKLMNSPYVYGRNTIKILRVSDKYVRISENLFGTHQEHQRFDVMNALNYINYRINQLQHTAKQTEQLESIDIKTQSKQYQTQYSNLQDVIYDLQNHIDRAVISHCKSGLNEISYVMSYDQQEKALDISFSNGFNVTIYRDSELSVFVIKYNLSLSTIQTSTDIFALSILYQLAQLIHNTSYESMQFSIVFDKYFIFNENLQKLYTEFVNDSTQAIEDDIRKFIVSKNTHTYTYQLSNFANFSRTLTVKKITRVRTILYVTAKNAETGEEFIEFKDQINKISHFVQDNSLKIAKLIKRYE